VSIPGEIGVYKESQQIPLERKREEEKKARMGELYCYLNSRRGGMTPGGRKRRVSKPYGTGEVGRSKDSASTH